MVKHTTASPRIESYDFKALTEKQLFKKLGIKFPTAHVITAIWSGIVGVTDLAHMIITGGSLLQLSISISFILLGSIVGIGSYRDYGSQKKLHHEIITAFYAAKSGRPRRI